MYVCVCVYMYVCWYVYMYACLYVSKYLSRLYVPYVFFFKDPATKCAIYGRGLIFVSFESAKFQLSNAYRFVNSSVLEGKLWRSLKVGKSAIFNFS